MFCFKVPCFLDDCEQPFLDSRFFLDDSVRNITISSKTIMTDRQDIITDQSTVVFLGKCGEDVVIPVSVTRFIGFNSFVSSSHLQVLKLLNFDFADTIHISCDNLMLL